MPRFVDLQQGSPDWLAWRQKGIGCSDIAIIMEESPFMSAYQLWQLKCGFAKAKPPSERMQHGTDSEVFARQWYATQYGETEEPSTACAAHSDYAFLRGSADGWIPSERIGVEIKVPGPESFRRAKEGHIPEMYALQMMGLCEVFDAEKWHYCVCDVEDGKVREGVIIPFERDRDYWNLTVLPRLEWFWQRVQAQEWPCPDGDETQTSQEWVMAADTWLAQTERRAQCDDAVRRAAATMRRLATARRTKGGGIEARWEQWRPKSTVTMTFDSPEDAANALEYLKADEGLMAFVRREKYGPRKGEKKIWQTDSPANLVFKIEAR